MTAADHPFLEPADAREWREWLERNGSSSAGVWLAVGKKGGARTSLTYEAAVEEAIAHGWIDSTVRRLDADRFRQLFTPRRRGSQWSPSNKARVARLTAEGRMTPAGIAAVEAAKADGSWTILDDVEALVIPEDLASAFTADDAARRGFEAMPDSVKKQHLYRIASAKRPSTRAARVEETMRIARVAAGG